MATLAKGNRFLTIEQFLFKAAYYLRLILTVLARVFEGVLRQRLSPGTLVWAHWERCPSQPRLRVWPRRARQV